jgi:hypothetical protein
LFFLLFAFNGLVGAAWLQLGINPHLLDVRSACRRFLRNDIVSNVLTVLLPPVQGEFDISVLPFGWRHL